MKTRIISILALLLTVTQGAWAENNYYPRLMSTAPTEGPWTFEAVNNGYYDNSHYPNKSFNTMDRSAWTVREGLGYDKLTYQWHDNDGTGFTMRVTSIKTSRYMVLSTYTHDESVPSYTRKVLTWNYILKGKSTTYPQNVTLYAHTDLASLKSTNVDFTDDYSDQSGSTYHLAHLTQGGNTGTQSSSVQTKTFEFDNRNGSSAQTKTWALLMTHVVKNANVETANCDQFGSFKNDSYSWATYYYKYVTFNANGGTGTMSEQTVENSGNLTANAFTREGYTFAGWATSADGDVVYENGAEITATESSKGPVTLYAKWNDPSVLTETGDNEWTLSAMPAFDVELEVEYETELALSETTDNSAALTEWDDYEADVTLTRTLQAGSYNTFAAPFSTAIPEGWTVKELTSATFADGTLTLNFANAASIEAGKPYLVKVAANTDLSTAPFTEAIVSKDAVTIPTDYADFIPTLGKTTIDGVAADDVLFVAAGNTLKNPGTIPTDMKGFRAYFLLKNVPTEARGFALNLGDESTGIESLTASPMGEGSIYTLDGRRIGKAAQKGVYIQNGKKVIIK